LLLTKVFHVIATFIKMPFFILKLFFVVVHPYNYSIIYFLSPCQWATKKTNNIGQKPMAVTCVIPANEGMCVCGVSRKCIWHVLRNWPVKKKNEAAALLPFRLLLAPFSCYFALPIALEFPAKSRFGHMSFVLALSPSPQEFPQQL